MRMYEVRQNKEKVSRRIDAGGVRQKVKAIDIVQKFMIQRNGFKCHFPVLQKARIATNIDCPSWGNAWTLGSYIHGLFQTQFLSGGVGGIAMAAPPVANRAVEQRNPRGGFSDFAAFFPGFGIGYAELKPNTTQNLNIGALQMQGLNSIIGLALSGIPLNAIDPNAQPQPLIGPPIYLPIPNVGAPAPAPGTMPTINFAATGTPGLYVYDAW